MGLILMPGGMVDMAVDTVDMAVDMEDMAVADMADLPMLSPKLMPNLKLMPNPLLLLMLMLKLMLTLMPGVMDMAVDTVMVDTAAGTDTADTAVVVTMARGLLNPSQKLGVMDTVVDTDMVDTDVDTEDTADTDITAARDQLMPFLNLTLNPIPGVTTVAHMDTVTAIAMAAGDTVDMATTDKCHLSSKV